MPKILMPLGDATEALDTFYPYYRLPEDGYEVVVAGPEVAVVPLGAARDPAQFGRALGHHARAARLSHSRHRRRFAT